jgi:polyketide cyclase/dehydrase/lipid transport protein
MGLTVCPAAIVAAPVEVIWENLVQWERYSEWFDARLKAERREPEGPATVGQTIYFGAKGFGRILHFIYKVEEVNAERHQLGLHAFFPLGLQMKAHISCTPIDATTCRVQYVETAIFPPGWWGWFLETVGAKTIAASIDDSLQRLKRASERQYQQAREQKGKR